MAAHLESMSYFGATPWHKSGTVLTEDDRSNWEMVCKKSGLDWEVEKVGLQTLEENPQKVSDQYVVRRKSDQKQYAVLGKNWEPLQNRDCFKWFQPWIDSGLAKFETAGSLKEGRVVWALAEIQGVQKEIIDGDRVKEYVMLTNSHDGSLAIRGGFTPVRVVCWNTLSQAVSAETSKLLRIKHTRKLADNMESVREAMDLISGEFNANVELYKKLARSTIRQDDVVKLVKKVVLKVDDGEDLSTRNKNILEGMIDAIKNSPGALSAPGSAWQAYNGINWFLLNQSGTKSDESNRLHSAWFGVNKTKDQSFLNTLLQVTA